MNGRETERLWEVCRLLVNSYSVNPRTGGTYALSELAQARELAAELLSKSNTAAAAVQQTERVESQS